MATQQICDLCSKPIEGPIRLNITGGYLSVRYLKSTSDRARSWLLGDDDICLECVLSELRRLTNGDTSADRR